ncbi:MAG TPA: thiamine pyrophosphate-dependent enzyme, partial [Gammaproteobacteria bacterium]
MSRQWMKALQQASLLDGGNGAWLESLYESWQEDPASVDQQWRPFFEQLPRVNGHVQDEVRHSELRAEFSRLTGRLRGHRIARLTGTRLLQERKQVRVLQLINAYRFRGHEHATTDPLRRHSPEPVEELELAYHELSEADFGSRFPTGSMVGFDDAATLEDILVALNRTYCESVGAEYMHIPETLEKRWIQQRLESVQSHPAVPDRKRRWLLDRLTAAEGIERYLHSKYVGQKRFSLEGGESLIPMLDTLVQEAGVQGVKEIVIGMSHRGRLNVLVNILGKSPKDLFSEFEGVQRKDLQAGDVKYHQGFSSNIQTPGGLLHVALAFNPSHLEIVSPVVHGSVRARQQRYADRTGDRVMPIVIHGDSAFAGQGVVMETFNMSGLRGYTTRGTVHVVINNQIGFTTSHRDDARSTLYCSDVAKMVNAPIFHVNGDDPEAVYFVTRLALDYRMTFNKDVVVDLVCYRRHGHNEADEPSATQPMMYREIKALTPTRGQYATSLEKAGVIDEGEAQQRVEAYRGLLDAGSSVTPDVVNGEAKQELHLVDWHPYIGRVWDEQVDTAVSLAVLQKLSKKLLALPTGFELHPRVAKILDDRRKMAAGALPVDWGCAEALAMGSLLQEG